MRFSYKIFYVLLILLYQTAFANVDIRVTQISNTHNSPSPGSGTLILDVEAQSTSGNVSINTFQDAIQVNASLLTQIITGGSVVTFSNELFPSSDYTSTQEFRSSDGRIRFIYTFDSGTRSQILTSWTRVVRVTIQYTMASQTSSIAWTSLTPDFYVSNSSNANLTGSEGSLPSSVPLPVQLTSFTASIIKSNVSLNWKTATEINNYGFDVQRKTEISNWEKIGFVRGNGNSNSPKQYLFNDKNPVSGKIKYRLKQIDDNGSHEFSKEVEVVFESPEVFSVKQNFPNPFNPVTTIEYQISADSYVSLKIFNSLGQEVSSIVNSEQRAGYYKVTFNGSSLSSGVYYYQLRANNFSSISKMLLLK